MDYFSSIATFVLERVTANMCMILVFPVHKENFPTLKLFFFIFGRVEAFQDYFCNRKILVADSKENLEGPALQHGIG